MGRVMPCEELLVAEIWLRDIIVDGMRLGERLDVARRSEPCWVELLDVVGVDPAGLSLPRLSGSGLADTLRGLPVC